MTDETIGDVVGEEGRISMNFSKFQSYVKKCKEDKLNKTCRLNLKEIGVNFVDE